MNYKNVFPFSLLILMMTISCKDHNLNQNEKNNSSQESVEKVESKDSAITENNKKETSERSETFEYVCFTNDNDKSKRIWVEFSENGKANQLKYEGQTEVINLKFIKEEINKGGAHPSIKTYYQEIYKGETNGKYILTHSGVWDYVKYIRGKDGKKFNYTIDHSADPYSKKPCF